MDELRRRIVEDLSGMITGEVRCDRLVNSMYASDGSLFQVTPLGVVFPRDQDDVVAVARYAGEQNIPLIPRGAGTNVTGASLGNGLIVDFSRHMNRILSIGETTVRVQPGVVRDQLNQALAPHGRYFAPDPSNSAITTVGGMLAVDAAGSHSIRDGSVRDHVRLLHAVLIGGDHFDVGIESLKKIYARTTGEYHPSNPNGEDDSPSQARKRKIISQLGQLLNERQALIEERQPLLIRNSSGYFLRNVLSDDVLNLPRLLVGSEGTLAIFTEAVLHTTPIPPYRGVVLMLFAELEQAVRAVQTIIPQQPSACDLLDRRLLMLAREADSRFEKIVSPAAEAALLVEQVGYSAEQVQQRIQQVIRQVRALHSRVQIAQESYTDEEVEFLWSLPRTVVPLLSQLKGQHRPQPFIEDVAVRPDSLHEFLVQTQKVFQKHQVTSSLYAHAAAGQIHLRPFLPALMPHDARFLQDLAQDLYQVVFSVGGTISGEHGDGMSRTGFVRQQYGPLYTVFQQVKEIFDPHNLLNPGKILSNETEPLVQNLRLQPEKTEEYVELQLLWRPAEMVQTAVRCNGCGSCRTLDPETRMCPLFRLDLHEESSPRAKANVMRNLAAGQIDPQIMTTAPFKRLADLCFNCKQCVKECPSNVDIPHLMIEAKAEHVSANGLPNTEWILSRIHAVGTWGCRLSWLINPAMRSRPFRWLLEHLVGLARERKVAPYSSKPFVKSLPKELTTKPEKKGDRPRVAYFVDYFANYHDAAIARAFIAVLQHNDIPVFVPPGQTSSGMAMVSAGDLQAARRLAHQNLREMIDLAREGFRIVCTEPAAVLCLRDEYPLVLDHPDTQLLSQSVQEAGAFLKELHEQNLLRTDVGELEMSAGYHLPCHLRYLTSTSSFCDLLTLIPKLQVHTINAGCSGMAGTFGLAAENYSRSMQIGEELRHQIQDPAFQFGLTECSSCRTQMEQGTNRRVLHPIVVLAWAYGLMPEYRQEFTTAIAR
ncbi:MAG: FAD-linked oxidase C-terminal domain-containing protein [Planctomycetaceae bacterium]